MNKDILRRIEQRLVELNITQSEVARAADIERSFLKNLRSAIRSESPYGISIVTLKKLAPALKTTATWLTEGDVRHVTDISRAHMAQLDTTILRPVGAVTSSEWDPVSKWSISGIDENDYPIMGHTPNESQIHFYVDCTGIERLAKKSDVLLCTQDCESTDNVTAGDFVVVDRITVNGQNERGVAEVKDSDGKLNLWSLSAKQRLLGVLAKDLDELKICAKVICVISKIGRQHVG